MLTGEVEVVATDVKVLSRADSKLPLQIRPKTAVSTFALRDLL
jgi:aspartyl-tRNA synthetase